MAMLTLLCIVLFSGSINQVLTEDPPAVAEPPPTSPPDAEYDYCANNDGTFPLDASTSFEHKTNPLAGWESPYRAPIRRFQVWTNSTPGINTGPDKAIDGDYYVYFQGNSAPPSRPLFRGDRALLISPGELSGCFCLSFWCHMNTDGEARLRLYSFLGVTYMDTSTPITEWTKQSVTVNFGHFVGYLVFEAVRGSTGRAEVALDDISFTKGPCQQ